jgi:6-phosphofructo-2-kinase / fructose-2,6-biphosphatase 3
MQTMPEAAGAVAAAAVADRLHGSKEDRKLAIILVNIMLLVFYDLHC